MPQYLFHLHERGEILRDEEGKECQDGQAAADAALICARHIIAHDAIDGQVDLNSHIEVVDVSGHVVADIPFSEAIVIGASRGAERS